MGHYRIDVMSSNLQNRRRQSGALFVWLAIVTFAMSLALFLSWMHQSSPDPDRRFDADTSRSSGTPVKELQLLASEVVSRGKVMAQNSGQTEDVSADISRASLDTPSNSHSNARPVQNSSSIPDPETLADQEIVSESPSEPVADAASEIVADSTPQRVDEFIPEDIEESTVEFLTEPDTPRAAEPLQVSVSEELASEPALEPDFALATASTSEPAVELAEESASETVHEFPKETDQALIAETAHAGTPVPAEETDYESLWQQILAPTDLSLVQSDLDPLDISDAGANEVILAEEVSALPEESQQLAYLQQDQSPVDLVFVGQGSDSVDELLDREVSISNDASGPSPQLDDIRSLMDEVLAIDPDELLKTTQASIRREMLESLTARSADIRFASGSKSISEPMDLVLSDIFDILTRYDDTQVTVSVSTSETGSAVQDLRLSQERGRAIIARAVSQGIDLLRLSLDAGHGESLPGASHTVTIRAQSLSNQPGQ